MGPVAGVTVAVLGEMLGIAAVVLGGADDSPGLQGLGVLVLVASTWFGLRSVRGGQD